MVYSKAGMGRWKEAQEAEIGWWLEGQKVKYDTRNMARMHRASYSVLLKRIGKFIGAKRSDKVLDLGCGPSCTSAYFPWGEKYGVDPLIDEFRKAGYMLPAGMTFKKGVGEKIPFKKGFFDVVMCMNAIDHSRSPPKVIDECARVLRPGGHLVLEMYVQTPALAFVLKTAEGSKFFRQKPHPHFFTKSDVIKLVSKRFEIVDVVISECGQRLRIPEKAGKVPITGKMLFGARNFLKTALMKECLVVGRVKE